VSNRGSFTPVNRSPQVKDAGWTPTANLDDLEGQISCPERESNCYSSVVQAVD